MFRILAGAALFLAAAWGQPSFEVASIRTSKDENRRENIQANPGTLSMRNVSLKSAIRWAYHVMDYQVSGPEWMGSERFTISAKAAGDAPEDQLRLMLETLLAERFKLAIHRETKELSAYLLVVAKGGIKFHESKLEVDEPVLNPDKARLSVEVQGVSAAQFVEMLSNILHAPVINNTGLSGRYDAAVNISKYMPDGSTPFDPVATIILALQEELGLKLEAKKLPLDLLIIDHVEKIPAGN
jgi:uncharacterized protein (TIGR03435 family)